MVISWFFGPGGLPAPCVLVCAMHSLAIVITFVRSLFFSLRLLLLTHFEETPMCEIIFHPIFWHNKMICAKKNYFLFIYLLRKLIFGCFSAFSASVKLREQEPTLVPGIFSFRSLLFTHFADTQESDFWYANLF